MIKLISFLLLFSATSAVAQVHQQGGSAVDLTLAKTGIGATGGLGYIRNFTDASFLQLRGFAEFGRMYNFKYSHYAADVMVYTSPFYLSDFIQFNAGAGITLGYEKVNGITKEKASGIGFMAGFKAGGQLEAFLSDQLSFFMFGQQAYLVKKSLGSNYYEAGLGIRLFLNNHY